MIKKEHFKEADNKRKKEKRDNLDNDEKEKLRKHKKKGKRDIVITLGMVKKNKLEKMIKKKDG